MRNRIGLLCAASSVYFDGKMRPTGGAASSPHAVARPLPRPVNVLTAGEARKRLETDDFRPVTDSTASSRIMLVCQNIGGIGCPGKGRLGGIRGRTIGVGPPCVEVSRDAAHSGDRCNVACCCGFARLFDRDQMSAEFPIVASSAGPQQCTLRHNLGPSLRGFLGGCGASRANRRSSFGING